MAHDKDTKAAVRRGYVVDKLPLTAAADRAGVSYSTARAWKSLALQMGDDWDHAQAADAVGEGGVKELTRVVLMEFVPLFRSTIEQLKFADGMSAADKAEAMSRLADAYTKTVKTSGAVDPSVAQLGWAMDVMRLLAQFCAQRFPEHQAALLEIMEPFGEKLAQEYG